MPPDESKQLFRLKMLTPMCECGEEMYEFFAFWLSENMQLVFVGKCGGECPINQAVVNVERAVAEIRSKDITECQEVSITGEKVEEDGIYSKLPN